MVCPSLLAEAPEQMLQGLAGDLLVWGDLAHGGDYLDLLERARPPIPPGSKLAARLAALRCFQHGQTGHLERSRRRRPRRPGPSRSGSARGTSGTPPSR